MTDPTPGDPRHPRLHMQGPRTGLPAAGAGGGRGAGGVGGGDLPYAGEPSPSGGRRRLLVLLLALVIGVGAAGAAVALAQAGGDGDGERAEAGAPRATSTSTSTRASASSSTTAPATSTTTTTAPLRTTTTNTSPTASIPYDDLPRHEAVYQDGKLILQGTVPNEAVQERFREEAAAVIGAGNVVVRYQIDPRVPVPTDGRVRVADDFLFAAGSARIDPAYQGLMDLGVTVMRLNPAARMRIVGHTDDSGSTGRNLQLSQARADALKGYLVANGIAASRVDAVGEGEADPVFPNDSDANRIRNRRIEVELLGLLAG